jgi:hypothetical protein
MAKTGCQHSRVSLARNVWLTHDSETTAFYGGSLCLDFTGASNVFFVLVSKHSSSSEGLDSPDGSYNLLRKRTALGDSIQTQFRNFGHYHEHEGPKDHDDREDRAEGKSESPGPGIGESETSDKSCDK